VTLDDALRLLDLPRDLGVHPESGEPVVAGLGRFGPYVKHGDDYRSLAPDDDVHTIDLARALALFAEPKRGGRRQMTKRVIRQIEASDGAAPIQVLEGRYGPYVTDGETNASIPKGMDPAIISLQEARGLIDARKGAPRRERTRAKAAKARRTTTAKSAEAVPTAALDVAKVANVAKRSRKAPPRKATVH
jgi:DNA topoisomerase-1